MNVLLIIGIWLTSALAQGQASTLLVDERPITYRDMTPYMEFFCTQDRLNLQQAMSHPNYQSSLSPVHFSYRIKEECWMRVTVDNQSAVRKTLLFEHQQALTSEIQLLQEQRPIQTIGYEHPFDQRQVKFSRPTFSVDIKPGLQTIYFKQRSKDQMWLHFHIWTPEPFHEALALRYFVNGGFVLLALGLACYNLIQFSIYPKVSLIFYVSYLIFSAMSHSFVNGYLKQFIWQNQNLYSNHFGLLSVQLAFLSAYGFVYTFLNLKQKMPKATWGVLLFSSIAIAAIFLNSLGYYTIIGAINLVLLVFGSFYLLFLSLILAIRGDRQAKYFSASWGCMIAGVIVISLTLFGVLPSHPLTSHANLLGGSLQMILMSFGIADQVKQFQIRMKQEKEHAFDQLQKMVYPHQLKKISQGINIEDTMPCRSARAVVICFDIVNSSQLDPSWSKEFVSKVLGRCQELMEANFDSDTLSARAYRIKELGDGFLCSVGFPFQTLDDNSLEDSAIDLALEFVDAFEETAQAYQHTNNLLCSVGIARGDIEGFFTVSGACHYELFGKGIILATRYENIRKKFGIQRSKHLVTLQEEVYMALSADRGSAFKRYDLHRDLIRDDHGATCFYFRNIKAANRSFTPLALADGF
ncbi:7TM diverse intracellular signaling domain-containing protein [Pseudobacteriovorax antillogorgiicola]|uniref:Adenylate and Guanylate cyclase catalytic domain-containing protein n=1 Tax=Pseudobacteriovorax antillogorgiicola TaxID=1513793 RepID=A0A1Y6C935_9BACT|nr:7TM diverse intracellular signaling domain-containing protein [Pseudobacteriovorax antillogorgiicola]TCS50717.1 adenylate/guanylate cyclase family protein [Pseudobacteriovorax antillogorgiicola]SMF40678.1 Adenylate and Guanylate cyclase catalytic domain-containing protein [Pseudobacteriovorax antillogorgiicola]